MTPRWQRARIRPAPPGTADPLRLGGRLVWVRIGRPVVAETIRASAYNPDDVTDAPEVVPSYETNLVGEAERRTVRLKDGQVARIDPRVMLEAARVELLGTPEDFAEEMRADVPFGHWFALSDPELGKT